MEIVTDTANANDQSCVAQKAEEARLMGLWPRWEGPQGPSTDISRTCSMGIVTSRREIILRRVKEGVAATRTITCDSSCDNCGIKFPSSCPDELNSKGHFFHHCTLLFLSVFQIQNSNSLRFVLL